MENAHNWNSNEFYKHITLEEWKSISQHLISGTAMLNTPGHQGEDEALHYLCDNVPFSSSFSELGCHAVTIIKTDHRLVTFLPLTSHPFHFHPPPVTPPQSQNLTFQCLQPSRTSFLHLPALNKGLQAQALAVWAHMPLMPCHVPSFTLALTMLQPNEYDDTGRAHRSLRSWFPTFFISLKCSWDRVSFQEKLRHSALE